MLPLRAIGFLGLYGVLLLAAFVFPAAGVWGFLFESNYHPPFNPWWGKPLLFLGERWSFLIGAVMVTATLVHWESLRSGKVFNHRESVLLLLFTLNTLAVTAWSYNMQLSLKEAIDNFKWLVVYICIVRTHSNRKWLPIVLVIYIVGAVDAGWQMTFDAKAGRFARGGPVTCNGENFLSPHVIAFIPFLAFYAVSPGIRWWARLGSAAGIPFLINAVAHGQSRGAFLALIAAGLVMPFVTRGRLRVWTLVALALGALLCLRLFHEQFWNRMSTIQEYQQDGSATGRTLAWKNAWDLSLRNPLGWGGEAFDSGLRTAPVSTHSMYFECLVAWGFQGTFLWFAYIGTSIWDCRKLAQRLYQPGKWPQSREYLDSVAMQAALISMLISAVFVNRMRWELWWVFPAYVVCLKNICAARGSTPVRRAAQVVARPAAPPRFAPAAVR
jgi:hypothetical protein